MHLDRVKERNQREPGMKDRPKALIVVGVHGNRNRENERGYRGNMRPSRLCPVISPRDCSDVHHLVAQRADDGNPKRFGLNRIVEPAIDRIRLWRYRKQEGAIACVQECQEGR